MSYRNPPQQGYGYIYILSNEETFKKGIYKIGLTTNSVGQRIAELTTTGVPTVFKPEKIFMIKEDYLERVEKAIHIKLKSQSLHHGKEFFKADLDICVQAVEDCIHEVNKMQGMNCEN